VVPERNLEVQIKPAFIYFFKVDLSSSLLHLDDWIFIAASKKQAPTKKKKYPRLNENFIFPRNQNRKLETVIFLRDEGCVTIFVGLLNSSEK
jgi:hypothetical protein